MQTSNQNPLGSGNWLDPVAFHLWLHSYRRAAFVHQSRCMARDKVGVLGICTGILSDRVLIALSAGGNLGSYNMAITFPDLECLWNPEYCLLVRAVKLSMSPRSYDL